MQFVVPHPLILLDLHHINYNQQEQIFASLSGLQVLIQVKKEKRKKLWLQSGWPHLEARSQTWSTYQWTYWLTLGQHSINIFIDTWLTLNQQSVSSLLNVNQLICIDQQSMTCLWKWVDSWLTIDRGLDWVSMEVLIERQWRCWLSVNQVSV